MFKPGDLVKVRESAVIPALIGSTGTIIRKLGSESTQTSTGPGEHESYYYEVDIAAQGRQILLERELKLLATLADRQK
jgi:hypothetical protein